MARLINRMDKVLLLLTIIMFIFGLFMILDASSMKSFMENGTNTKYFIKQLIILIVSLVMSFFIMCIPTKKYKKIIIPICIIIVGLLLFLLIKGDITSGAQSWIYIGSFGLQPSEFAKIALIIFSGIYYRANIKNLNRLVPALVPVILGAIFTLLTLLQPDAGTAIIILFITIALFYASPVTKEIKLKVSIAGLFMFVIGLLFLMIFGKKVLTGSQIDRLNFLKPCTRYQESTGYQVCNGYIAINNGKLFSISPGNSQQKYLYLPEAFTDFIFPILVEEFGLLVGISVILIYMIIIYRCIRLARKSVNTSNALICYGVACYIFLHVVINLVGVFGLMPLTGVPLPFISYGGSYALSLAISLAIVQRISIENYNYMQQKVLSE